MVRKRNKKKKGGSQRQPRHISQIAGIAIILVLLVIIFSMIASQFFPDFAFLDTPRRVVTRIITPVQKTFAGATDMVAGYLRKLKYRSTLEEEYQKLQDKVDELTDKAMRVEALEYQLAQAADLNDEILRNPKMDGIKANVIGRDTSNYTFTLTIDAGKNQGIENNMAVAVPGALIGYTYDVKPSSASVKGLIDTDCSIAALIESSRDQGTVRGTLAINGKKECRMFYLSYSTLPRPGDRVVTSGVGMEFPKGVPIGIVRESTRGLEDSKQYIVVDPIADFDHIEYVIVYRYRPLKAEKAAERGTMAQATFIPLPTAMPVPTFMGQKTALTPTPVPSPTPAPEETRTPMPDESPAPEDSVIYNEAKVAEDQTPAPLTPTPTPTPQPKPTFSVEQMTVEEG